MAVEPITRLTPRPIRRSILVQWWRQLTFLHWAIDPAIVAPLLPAGTRPDTLDGVSYLGLIPFQMYRVGALSGPGLPYVGTFCETNVRLYSVDGDGRRGVVFLSLDAARLLPVLVAQAGFRLPYIWSSMRMRHDGSVIDYSCRRTRRGRRPGSPEVTSRVIVRTGPPIAEPSPLEHFLTARWGLHVSWHGRTLYLPNEHPAWPLHQAELMDFADDLIAATGLPAPTTAPISVLYSPGVPVRFGVPSAVSVAPN